jgi:hypothetical protein
MKLKPFQQRVVDEKTELDSKLSKLKEFIASKAFVELDGVDKNLLEKQSFTMREYSIILGERIKLFKGE